MRTDQKSLKHLLEQRAVQPGIAKWLVRLLGYDFEIQYKPGLENKAADALSRIVVQPQLHSLTMYASTDVDRIKQEVNEDPKYMPIIKELQQDSHPTRLTQSPADYSCTRIGW